MITFQNLEGEIIQLILSTKRVRVVPLKRKSSEMADWMFMKLDTVVEHYLEMCMKEYV